MRILFILLLGIAVACRAHTPEEETVFIRNALEGVLLVADDDAWSVDGRNPDPNGVLESWEGFLGQEDNGWSMAERRAAFDRYLESLATADCQRFSGRDKRLVLSAFSRCRRLAYTNAVPCLWRVARNSNCVYRTTALSACIELSPVASNTTDLVESVVTNLTLYSRSERGTVCGKYAKKLLQETSTNALHQAVRDVAVRRLYKNRTVDIAGANMLDTLFVSLIDGWGGSSNRLEFATFVLEHPDCNLMNTEKFVSVTNQLLSSGQPLRQLNIGDAGE